MNNYVIIDETPSNPMVSVAMLAYNHENFIVEAIESVLMQKTDHSIQLVIAEDCSKDDTRAILLEFQNKFPDKIKLILQNTNVGSRLNNMTLLTNLEGKYIAALEGDDYWTDPLKLQKQVDFLIDNPQYSFTCHRYQIYSEYDKKFDDELHPLKFIPYDESLGGVVIDKAVYHSNWLTQPLTTVFRKNALMKFDLNQFKHFRDVHLFYILLLKSNGFCHDWNAGVYRKHSGGIHSGSKKADRSLEAVLISEELYLFSKDNRFFKIYTANAILLLRTKHLIKLYRSFFIKLSMIDKIDLLRFSVQYYKSRLK